MQCWRGLIILANPRIKNTIIHYYSLEKGIMKIDTINNGIEEVYIPANDNVEQLINIDYWFEVPQK
jgi:hypothetical protein